MPRPIARVLQELQNAVIQAGDPVLKSVIVGPHVYVREYPDNRATLLSDKKLGQPLKPLMSSAGTSPTVTSVSITDYPDNITGAVIVDSSVEVWAEGWIEVTSENDGATAYQSNTLASPAGDFSNVAAGDRVILQPTAVQILEDLTQDFVALGVTPGTDYILIGADVHYIAEVLSEHRLLTLSVATGSATLGYFAAADAGYTTSYDIGDNAPNYDNVTSSTAGQRRTWRQVKLFQDLNADFETAGVTAGHYLKIGGDVHEIDEVLDANNLTVKTGTTYTSPQNRGEFANDDAAANVGYSIGTQAGGFVNILDFTVSGTGQRIESLAAIRNVFSVQTATSLTLSQFSPFSGTAGAPINLRVEHAINNQNPPTGADGWELTGITVNPTTKDITIAADPTVTYASGSRKVITADLYVSYQSLRQDATAEIKEANPNSLDSDLGLDTKENVLRRAVGVAVANAGSTKIFYLAVPTDDQAGHTQAQSILANDRDTYCISPMTKDSSILQSYKTHATTLSDPSKAKRRIIVCQPGTLPDEKTVTSAKADGTAESTTVLFSPSADFDADNVIPGDVVTLTSPTTNSYNVVSVLSGNRLQVDGPFTAPEQSATGAVAFSVTRALDANGQVTELNSIPAGFNDKRVVTVWPDRCTVGSDSGEPGYYLAAAIAGLVAALPSHRMTTKIGLAGVSSVANSNNYFDDAQMTSLIDAGWYMVEQETPQSSPFSSQQYTSLGISAAVEERYLSSVKNFDYVAAQFQLVVDAFPGEWNVIDELFEAVEESIRQRANRLVKDKRPRIGSPILGYSNLLVQPSETQSDKIEASVRVRLPNVLNELDLRLISV